MRTSARLVQPVVPADTCGSKGSERSCEPAVPAEVAGLSEKWERVANLIETQCDNPERAQGLRLAAADLRRALRGSDMDSPATGGNGPGSRIAPPRRTEPETTE